MSSLALSFITAWSLVLGFSAPLLYAGPADKLAEQLMNRVGANHLESLPDWAQRYREFFSSRPDRIAEFKRLLKFVQSHIGRSATNAMIVSAPQALCNLRLNRAIFGYQLVRTISPEALEDYFRNGSALYKSLRSGGSFEFFNLMRAGFADFYGDDVFAVDMGNLPVEKEVLGIYEIALSGHPGAKDLTEIIRARRPLRSGVRFIFGSAFGLPVFESVMRSVFANASLMEKLEKAPNHFETKLEFIDAVDNLVAGFKYLVIHGNSRRSPWPNFFQHHLPRPTALNANVLEDDTVHLLDSTEPDIVHSALLDFHLADLGDLYPKTRIKVLDVYRNRNAAPHVRALAKGIITRFLEIHHSHLPELSDPGTAVDHLLKRCRLDLILQTPRPFRILPISQAREALGQQ